mmetsp:Transcript_94971/g.207720  ORF Transcript_94971/g.207720 Transcript_94971/m.207720 type:complete len:438 (-) Transcript_94971:505-1818(-)
MGRKRGGESKCWRCGGKGHTQQECPEVDEEERNKRCCFVCQSLGHTAAECPQREEKVKEVWPKIARVLQSPQSLVEGATRKPDDVVDCGARMSVLITTSPVPSNPSTMMLEAVLASFSRIPGLSGCPIVLVCDGFRYSGKSTWKAGQVTEDAAVAYEEYKKNLEGLLESKILPPGTKIVILEGRNGQALAVKAGLSQVETPFVLVHQHDLEFMFDFNLPRVLDVLEDESNDVKYVGMPLLTNLHYEAIAYQHHGVRVEEVLVGGLKLVPIVFWYDSTHITSVSHYGSLVFSELENYRPGDFVEETFGVRQRADIMAKTMAIHPRYGTYHCLSYGPDNLRRPLICHLNGVRFLTPEQRAARGYPADPGVEFFPSRTMTNKRHRRLKAILDLIVGLSGVDKSDEAKLKDVLSKLLNETRLRSSQPASACLPRRAPVAAN